MTFKRLLINLVVHPIYFTLSYFAEVGGFEPPSTVLWLNINLLIDNLELKALTGPHPVWRPLFYH